ncbi:MAG: ABC transporter permease, partial [Candidatus Zixiibacteriota bacterium]
MIRSYLTVALRNMLRHKGYSFINIVGLAVGMASCILLAVYVDSELSVDRYHEYADRIHRLCVNVNMGGTDIQGSSSNATAAVVLREKYPEVIEAVRFGDKPGSSADLGSRQILIRRMQYADNSAFGVFSWPFIKGNPDNALIGPYSIVLTEDLAQKLFGEEDPLGKAVRFPGEDAYAVTGVIENIPPNSIFGFEALCSFSTLYSQGGGVSPSLTDWTSFNYRTYVLLQEGVDCRAFSERISTLIETYAGDQLKAEGSTKELFLRPLRDMYLRPLGQAGGPIFYVYVFSAIALIILLIGCTNFMNLTTARFANRAREVGMRKVFGAERRKLVIQFLSETLLLTCISFALAVLLVEIALPGIETLARRDLPRNVFEIPGAIPGLIVLVLSVGLLAGSYPAFFLSSFRPVTALHGFSQAKSSRSPLRSILVVGQFTASIALICGTGLIIDQLIYMKEKNPGFDKEHVVILRARNAHSQKSIPLMKEEFGAGPGVISVAASSTIPGLGAPINAKIPEGYDMAHTQLMDEINVDADFIETLGIEIVAGRNFSYEFGSDEKHSAIINETAARRYGWKDPVGKIIKTFNPHDLDDWVPTTVIGVVRDFHLRAVSETISPLYMGNYQDYPFRWGRMDMITVRIAPEDLEGTIRFLRDKWNQIVPDVPFDFFFLDENFDGQFRNVERSRNIMSSFTGLAIFIACLGLFGLTSYAAEQRTKEIGIRKVLGSSCTQILKLLCKEIVVLVIVANTIAWPLAYLAMDYWLQDFAYRTDINIATFIMAGL